MEQSEDTPATEVTAFPEESCRLILIGKTGVGKSATGNTIVGCKKFTSRASINSETEECGYEETVIENLNVLVIDTPGLADTGGDDRKIALRITRTLCAIQPGPHAVLLVLRCDRRFTDEEYKVFQALKEIFGPKLTDHMIVIFAGKDELEEEDFQEAIKKCKKLDDLLNESNRRYMLFDNKADVDTKKQQVSQLLLKVKEMVVQNGGKCFVHKASKEIMEAMDAMTKEELRKNMEDKESYIWAEEQTLDGNAPVTTPETESAEKPTSQENMTPLETQIQPPHEDAIENSEDVPLVVKMKKESQSKAADGTLVELETDGKEYEERNKNEDGLSPAQKEAVERQQDINQLKRSGTVKERLKRLSQKGEKQDPKREPGDGKSIRVSRQLPPQRESAFTAKPQTQTNTDRPTETPQLVPDQTEKDARATKELPVERGEAKELLITPSGEPGMTKEKTMQMLALEDALKRQLATAPLEELTDAQRGHLEATAKSIGPKIKHGMTKFKVRTIEQCSLM